MCTFHVYISADLEYVCLVVITKPWTLSNLEVWGQVWFELFSHPPKLACPINCSYSTARLPKNPWSRWWRAAGTCDRPRGQSRLWCHSRRQNWTVRGSEPVRRWRALTPKVTSWSFPWSCPWLVSAMTKDNDKFSFRAVRQMYCKCNRRAVSDYIVSNIWYSADICLLIEEKRMADLD